MSKCVKCGNEILTGDIHWEMGLCNNCYNELYKDHKTHISLDKMWLELAQSFRDENEKLQDKVADLETKLAESEKQIKDAREAGNMAVVSWCKNRRKYEAQIAEMQNKSFILYSMLYETLEKQGCDNVASQIDQMTGWTYDKEADWLKGNRNYDQLKQQLAESEKSKESYRLQNEHHHLQLLQFYSRLGVEAFGADIHEKALETLMIMKEQLTEKEKEIEELKLKLDIRAISLQNFNIERMQANQNKISFAVEQLEQIINLFEPYENEEKDTILCANNGISFLEYIDNQIEELKKEMK